MKEAIGEQDVVALVRDPPEHNLVAVQAGTVVERLDKDVFEVGFCGDPGRIYALPALPADDVVVLHYAPVTVS